ncbi:transposase, partial [Methylobacterium sp. BTF04]|nr:transposase [Methylobacterium sp. BTF04]
MALPDPDGLDALSLSELRGLVVGLIAQVRGLTDENRALRDEVARLKGLPPRPPTRPTPSGMEAASERAQADPGKRRRRGPVRDRCVVTRE